MSVLEEKNMNEKDYGILYEFLKPAIEKMYQYLYVSGNNVENYIDAVQAFDVFSKNNPEFISAVVNSRHDFISSDREAAAFMMAFSGMYVPPEWTREENNPVICAECIYTKISGSMFFCEKAQRVCYSSKPGWCPVNKHLVYADRRVMWFFPKNEQDLSIPCFFATSDDSEWKQIMEAAEKMRFKIIVVYDSSAVTKEGE